MKETNLVKSNITYKEKQQDNLEKTVKQIQSYQVKEQFCSCCKPVDFFDFLNKKKPLDMFCSETFVPDSKLTSSPTKSHKIFVKKNDI
jgi:hypothetical protein